LTKKRVGVLISGRGSNLQALIDACERPGYPAEIVLVISNVPGAQGLLRAEEAGILATAIDHKKFSSREAFDQALCRALDDAKIDLLCNAGFMRLHTEGFVEHWRDRHINIHPSLLPAFRGLDTHARVLAAGVTLTG
jgi:phosphoribosylglycinamide formyltransferase-1